MQVACWILQWSRISGDTASVTHTKATVTCFAFSFSGGSFVNVLLKFESMHSSLMCLVCLVSIHDNDHNKKKTDNDFISVVPFHLKHAQLR